MAKSRHKDPSDGKGLLSNQMKNQVYQWYLDGYRVDSIARSISCSKSVVYRALREFPPVPEKQLVYDKTNRNKGRRNMADIQKKICEHEDELEKLCLILDVMETAYEQGVEGDIGAQMDKIETNIDELERKLDKLYNEFENEVSYYTGR